MTYALAAYGSFFFLLAGYITALVLKARDVRNTSENREGSPK